MSLELIKENMEELKKQGIEGVGLYDTLVRDIPEDLLLIGGAASMGEDSGSVEDARRTGESRERGGEGLVVPLRRLDLGAKLTVCHGVSPGRG